MADIMGGCAIVPDPHHAHEWCLVNQDGIEIKHSSSWGDLMDEARRIGEEEPWPKLNPGMV